MTSWIDTELKATNMPDKRLHNRLERILQSLSKDPQKSIPSNCESWSSTQATYRFLNNRSITSTDILKGHTQATVKRVGCGGQVSQRACTTEFASECAKKLSSE